MLRSNGKEIKANCDFLEQNLLYRIESWFFFDPSDEDERACKLTTNFVLSFFLFAKCVQRARPKCIRENAIWMHEKKI